MDKAPRMELNKEAKLAEAKRELSRMYEIRVADGEGGFKTAKMSGLELYRQMENSLQTGANASQMIEGEPSLTHEELDYLKCTDPIIMAERLRVMTRSWQQE